MNSELGNAKPYRPCIVGVFINERKEVLVAQRSDTHTWQFPQGGVEEGESSEEALFREMKEEIGCDQFDVIEEASSKLHYDFPSDYKGPLLRKFKGQEQSWFLCRFKRGFGPDLQQSSCNEFFNTKWISPKEIASSVVEWKRETYFRGLSLLKLLD